MTGEPSSTMSTGISVLTAYIEMICPAAKASACGVPIRLTRMYGTSGARNRSRNKLNTPTAAGVQVTEAVKGRLVVLERRGRDGTDVADRAAVVGVRLSHVERVVVADRARDVVAERTIQ